MMKRRKKLFVILSMALAAALLLTGCTTSGGEVGTGTTTAGTTASTTTTVATTRFSPSSVEDHASLSIYIYTGSMTSQDCYLSDVYDFYADYKNMIDITIEEFEDAEEMESRLQMELAAGQGPDVILADAFFGLDMMSLAANGAFYDLTDEIAADATFTDEKYYTSVMEAGQVDGRQYIVPLSFSLPTFVSTTTALGEMGINLETDTTIEVYEKILAYLKASNDPQATTCFLGYVDTVLALMLSCGKTPVSYETGEVNLDGEEERMLVELGTEFIRDWNMWASRYTSASNPEVEMTKLPLIYTNSFTSPFQLQLYYSGYAAHGYADEVEFYFSPDADGNHYALVHEFAAVNANVENPRLAWKFLRFIMDHNQNRDVYTALSLNRNVTLGYVRRTTTDYGRLGQSTLERLPQELSNQILNACGTISGATLHQRSLMQKIIAEPMMDYIKGDITFDTMVDTMRNKMKLYINE